MSKDFASGVLNRLFSESQDQFFTLPEMTIADYVVWFDNKRIPEALEQLARCLNVTPERRASEAGQRYIQEKEQECEDLQFLLDVIGKMFNAGDISQGDYDRLTTAQNYTHAHKQALSKQVAHFIPRRLGTACNHAPVFYLFTDDGSEIWLRYENEQWIRDDIDPFCACKYR